MSEDMFSQHQIKHLKAIITEADPKAIPSQLSARNGEYNVSVHNSTIVVTIPRTRHPTPAMVVSQGMMVL